MPRRALIVGGSMAGLFAGLYLRQRGWQVDIFERSATSLHGRGAGITTHPQMRSALANLGIQSELDFGVPVEQRLVLDRSGAVIARRTVPQISTSWNRLFDLLIARFGQDHYHRGSDVRTIAQTSEGVIANLADGTFSKRRSARLRPMAFGPVSAHNSCPLRNRPTRVMLRGGDWRTSANWPARCRPNSSLRSSSAFHPVNSCWLMPLPELTTMCAPAIGAGTSSGIALPMR